MIRALSLALLLTAGCISDETLSGYGGAETLWVLETINGKRFPARATLSLPEKGEILGETPCNGYAAQQTAPYPWFKIAHLSATARVCDKARLEGQFLAALSAMTLSEVLGNALILSNPSGDEMVFRPEK